MPSATTLVFLCVKEAIKSTPVKVDNCSKGSALQATEDFY